MSREHQERDKWRAHCVTFKDKRDVARVRVMLCEREISVNSEQVRTECFFFPVRV